MPSQSAETLQPADPARVAEAQQHLLSLTDAGRLTALLGLLADPVRVRILYTLNLVHELCVGDLALTLEASEDAVGYGLRMLRTAGLVQTRKDGRTVFYRLADSFPEPLLEHCLRELLHLSELAATHDDRSSRARPSPRSVLRRRHR